MKSRKYYELQNLDKFTLTPEEMEARRKRIKEFHEEQVDEKKRLNDK